MINFLAITTNACKGQYWHKYHKECHGSSDSRNW